MSSPLFARVEFASAAPILAVGATVAIGLHVAVFNLTHDRSDVPDDPDVVARLDAFATGGIVVALTSASAGWLLLWPDVAASSVDGLNLLGSMLSVVVVLVAGMAGHIRPQPRRHWPLRAARTSSLGSPGPRGIGRCRRQSA